MSHLRSRDVSVVINRIHSTSVSINFHCLMVWLHPEILQWRAFIVFHHPLSYWVAVSKFYMHKKAWEEIFSPIHFHSWWGVQKNCRWSYEFLLMMNIIKNLWFNLVVKLYTRVYKRFIRHLIHSLELCVHSSILFHAWNLRNCVICTK